MAASPNQSNILLYSSITLSLVSLCLFVVASCYFQSVINLQNEQLAILTDQQDDLKSEVTILKAKQEEDTKVSYADKHHAERITAIDACHVTRLLRLVLQRKWHTNTAVAK